MAKRLDFSIQYRRALWSVIVAEPSSGNFDLVYSAATVTAVRGREVDFCAPHLELSLALVTREELSADLDISASRVGMRHGTTSPEHHLPLAKVSVMFKEHLSLAQRRESSSDSSQCRSRFRMSRIRRVRGGFSPRKSLAPPFLQTGLPATSGFIDLSATYRMDYLRAWPCYRNRNAPSFFFAHYKV